MAPVVPGLLKHWVGTMAAAEGAGGAAGGLAARDFVCCIAETLSELGTFLWLCDSALEALLAAPEDVVGLLLAAAESSGSQRDDARVQSFEALATLAGAGMGKARPVHERLWASPALPVVFEHVMEAELCARRDGGIGAGITASGSAVDRAAVHLFFFLLHGAGPCARPGQLLLGWLNAARCEREPALDSLLARMLEDSDPEGESRWVPGCAGG